MDEAEGFFPEREVLRARRRRALLDQPVDPSEARSRRAGIWVLWFTVFLTMFVNAIVFGWNGHITPRAFEVIKYSLFLLLAACVGCVAVAVYSRPLSAKDIQRPSPITR
jgi:hypothetical protein